MSSNNKNIRPLIVTPKPKSNESLMGFILRTSELNGYTNPHWMLKYSGMSENEIRSISPPLHKLTSLYGYNIKEIEHLSYVPKKDNKYGKRFLLNGHDLNVKDIQVKKPKICPECIKLNMQTSMFWELAHASVCPTHRKKLISICPNCNTSLSWFREGLLRCKCGYDLSNTESRNIDSDNVIALSHILERKLLNQPINSPIVVKAKFPIQDINNLSFKSLNTIISKLINYKTRSKGKNNRSDYLEIAANALSDFPHGFHNYLLDCGPTNEEHSGFRKQYDNFYRRFFKNDAINDEEIKFLYDAFISFGTKHWKKGIISRSLHNNEHNSSHIVGIVELSKELKTTVKTIRKLVEIGRIIPTKLSCDNNSRYVFEITDDLPRRIETGNSLTSREAAKLIGVPDSVLKMLKEKGIFKFKFLGNKVNSFHEYDCLEFIRNTLSLVAKHTPPNTCMDDYISFSDIMKKKLGGIENKVKFIELFINGKFKAQFRTGHNLSYIYFRRSSIKLYLEGIKSNSCENIPF